MAERPADLITDWNAIAESGPPRAVFLHDETLRDGLQAPYITQPTLEDRLALLHLMDELGVSSADIGMPMSNKNAARNVTALASEVRAAGLALTPVCAARTVLPDVEEVACIADEVGVQMCVMAFVGISPIRLFVESWDVESVIKEVVQVVEFAVRQGLSAVLVTEDTTRSRLDVSLDVYQAALDAGASGVCACDTVGFAMPWGVRRLVSGLREGLAGRGHPDAVIDWHGHNDRGMALANSLAAVEAGADRVHATALGIGERAGNASMEQLLVNLYAMGVVDRSLERLPDYCELTALACEVPVASNQPFIGADVYRTCAGVHAAAIRKAEELGDDWIAERVYAGVAPSVLGRTQDIDVGPGSGHANVLHWLDRHDIDADDRVVRALGDAVAHATRVFTEEELLDLVGTAR